MNTISKEEYIQLAEEFVQWIYEHHRVASFPKAELFMKMSEQFKDTTDKDIIQAKMELCKAMMSVKPEGTTKKILENKMKKLWELLEGDMNG